MILDRGNTNTVTVTENFILEVLSLADNIGMFLKVTQMMMLKVMPFTFSDKVG